MNNIHGESLFLVVVVVAVVDGSLSFSFADRFLLVNGLGYLGRSGIVGIRKSGLLC